MKVFRIPGLTRLQLRRHKRLSTGAALCHESGMAKTKKNAAAVALGRLGGLKGGKARARKLTAKERSAIAKKVAGARGKEAAIVA